MLSMDNLVMNSRIKMLWEMLNEMGYQLEGVVAPVPRASFYANADTGERRDGFYLNRATRDDFTADEIKVIKRVADALGFNLRSVGEYEIDDDRDYKPSITFDL